MVCNSPFLRSRIASFSSTTFSNSTTLAYSFSFPLDFPLIFFSKSSFPQKKTQYFEQTPEGRIVEVWYEEGDSPYFVNIKLGAINAFQTKVVASPTAALETDVVGVHTANFAPSISAGVTTITKKFTQNDFHSFADPSVTTRTFSIDGTSTASVSAKNQIIAASVKQVTVYVDATVQSKPVTRLGDSSLEGFNMNLRSAGVLAITQDSSLAKNVKFVSPLKTTQELLSSPKTQGTDLLTAVRRMQAAQKAATATEMGATSIKDASVVVADALKDGVRTSPEAEFKALNALADQIRVQSASAIAKTMFPFVKKLEVPEGTVGLADLRRRLFYVLAKAGTAAAQDLLLARGLRSTSSATRLHAVLAVAALNDPGFKILDAISQLASDDSVSSVRSSALMTLGVVIGKSRDIPRVQQGAALLVQLLSFAVSQKDYNQADSVIRAIANAGPSLVPVSSLPAVALRDAKVAEMINNRLGPISALAAAGDLPYNKTFGFDFTLGGKIIGADFGGSVFGGSNFNCKNPTFNYEAYAQSNATLWLFGHEQQAFLAEAVYGKINGAPEADAITLSVWGKTVFSQNIPAVDCSTHTYPIAHAAPGVSVSHTIWVSVIPVTFQASADIDLNLSWSWQVCDSTLSATVSLLPAATLVVSGSATIDLLIAKAAASIDASFNQQLTPSASVEGSLCDLDFNVQLSNAPMTASFDVLYQFKKCKLWIFDCVWENPHTKTIWSWSGPSSSKSIFNKAFPISLATPAVSRRK
jgi:hypothetical protein